VDKKRWFKIVAKTLISGDSLTNGRIGIGFKKYLDASFVTIGEDGAPISIIFANIFNYLEKFNTTEKLTVVIQGGGNDLLRPHMLKTNKSWQLVQQNRGLALPLMLEDDLLYLNFLNDKLNQLMATSKVDKIIVCSITPLGEQLNSSLNVSRDKRNKLVKEYIERNNHIIWCDISTKLENIITVAAKEGNNYLINSPSVLEQDAITIKNDEIKADLLAEKRNLVVTIDGVHLNSIGAKEVATALQSCIKQLI
jgi:lysophospholipase L1-like esterase